MGLLSTTNIYHKRESATPYCREVKINEHKAPTDESIRLLNEMQDKAKENIIATIDINQNHLHAVAIAYCDEIAFDRIHYYVKFTLNNKEYVFNEYIRKSDLKEVLNENEHDMKSAYRKIIVEVHKRISEEIARQIMASSPEGFEAFAKSIL